MAAVDAEQARGHVPFPDRGQQATVSVEGQTADDRVVEPGVEQRNEPQRPPVFGSSVDPLVGGEHQVTVVRIDDQRVQLLQIHASRVAAQLRLGLGLGGEEGAEVAVLEVDAEHDGPAGVGHEGSSVAEGDAVRRLEPGRDY